jgi:multiple sugar transport system permease protein
MMIPFQVQMIPLYILFRNLGWINTYLPLIVPPFFGNPYFIFMLRQFFLTIPQDLSDAARVDGASELGILLRVVVPLAKPALAVVALFQFMGAWNDYLGPLIYLNSENMFPLALGLQSMRSSFQEALVWPYLMAASTMIVGPVILIFFLTQRTFVEGIALTGVKG